MAVVSVIVPAYNTGTYISRCLDSIVNQTLEDIEIICIDDGSVDSTPDILDDYARKDSRIRVEHVPNGGVSKARNIGLAIAQGEFVSFVDSDDFILPDMLEKIVGMARRNGSDIVQCALEEGCEDRTIYGKDEIILGFMSGTISKSVCSKLFTRKVVDGVFFSAGESFAEDFMFSIKTLEKTEVITLNKEVMYEYVDRFDSATKSAPNDKEMYFFSVLDYLWEVVKGNRKLEVYYNNLNLKETITFLTRFVGHEDVSETSINKLKTRLKECSKGYIHNPLLSKIEKAQVFVASKWPNMYVRLVLMLKRLRGN